MLNAPHHVDNFGRATTPGNTGEGMFPKIPGAEDNYGMVYNVPETAAEKAMHELWMARRRQEVAFTRPFVSK